MTAMTIIMLVSGFIILVAGAFALAEIVLSIKQAIHEAMGAIDDE